METREISDLAKAHVDAIFNHNLTKAEVIMLAAVIQARILETLLIVEHVTNAQIQPNKETIVVPKPLGAKIADKGYPCVCIACSKHIYTLNKDLYDNTMVKDFIESYTPMPGYPPISRKSKISNINNNITMDCPNPECHGELSLYLAGRQND